MRFRLREIRRLSYTKVLPRQLQMLDKRTTHNSDEDKPHPHAVYKSMGSPLASFNAPIRSFVFIFLIKQQTKQKYTLSRRMKRGLSILNGDSSP